MNDEPSEITLQHLPYNSSERDVFGNLEFKNHRKVRGIDKPTWSAFSLNLAGHRQKTALCLTNLFLDVCFPFKSEGK
jgi:hypothetical protein